MGPTLRLGGSAVLALTLACSGAKPSHEGTDGSGDDDDAGASEGDGDADDVGEGDGDDGDGDGDRDPSCATARVKAARAAPTIWLLVDQCLAPQPSEVSSDWSDAHGALMDDQGVLATLGDVARFGMVLTGDTEEEFKNSCGKAVDLVEPALMNRAAIGERYKADFKFYGYCMPYYGFKAVAARPRSESEAIVYMRRPSEDFVCNADFLLTFPPDTNIHYTAARVTKDVVTQLAGQGVKTFVVEGLFESISMPVSVPDQAQFSRDVASLGETSMPFKTNNLAELKQALTQITGQLVTCDVKLNGTVEAGSECSGYVKVDGHALDCNKADGWRLKDAKTVEITGTACTSLKQNPGATIEADFPCDVFHLE